MFYINSKLIFLSAFILCQLIVLPAKAQKTSAELLEAIKTNDAEAVKKLASTKLVNLADEDGDFPLMNAALYGSGQIMEILLQKGADPNAKNKDGETALMWSAQDPEKIKLLIKHGADINMAAKTGNTVLLIASVGNNQLPLIEFLVSQGADPLVKNQKGETSLMRAALFGDSSTISYLISRGVEMDAKDTSGSTALMNSIFNVNTEATLVLLEKGADPDLKALFGLTAVSSVVTYNDMPSINAVLQKAKNINTTDDGGISALMWAVYNEHDNPGIVQALLDKGADVNHKAKDGSTALSWALKKGNTKTVALLKQAGAR
jgi:ankyrin repeat protein